MTHRVDLPTTEQIMHRIEELTTTNDRPPAVIALARDLQLSNATFWRHFPSIAQNLADTRRAHRRAATAQDPGTDTRSSADSSRETPSEPPPLITRLQSDLEAAAHEIQRLTLENEALRAHLQDASSVLQIRPRET